MSIGTAVACCILTAWAVTIVWIVGLVLHAGKETTNMEGDHNV